MNLRLRTSHLQFLLLLAAVGLRLASESTASASYLLLAAYALGGRGHAIHALAMSWFFSMLSPGIAPDAPAASVGRFVVLGSAAFSVLLRSGVLVQNFRLSRPVLATLGLGVLLVLHSIFFSPIRDVSLLKAISWTVAAATLLSAWSGIEDAQRERLARQLFGGLTLLLVLSLPLLFFPLGYLRNGTGFQGLLSQPQAFGPTMGLLGAWAGSRMLATARPPWRLVALFGACAAMVVLSEARTAGLAMLGGIVVAGITGNAITRRSLRVFLPGLLSRRVHLVIALAAAGALLTAPIISARLGQFVSKRTEASSVASAYYEARGSLIERMVLNIREHPLRGIGFGIASEPTEMIVDRDPVLGLPTGASVEKGVLPVAVLEEIGVFGFIVVLLWVVMLVRRAANGGGMTALSVFFATLLLNLGESVLFSPGGMGLLSLVLIGWATTQRCDAQAGRVPGEPAAMQSELRHA